MPIPPLYPRSQRTPHAHRGNPSSSQPRDAKKKNRKKKIWSVVIVTSLILMLVGGIGSVALFAYFSKDLPDPEKINDRSVAESTRIYARDGTTLLY
jgi:membrane peptidoglycan carboxypeptidase